MTPPPRRVCVTGAGGFIGSWLVKLLLSRGYAVHGTVRDPALCISADPTLNTIIQKEVMAPTVKGTENVLEACSAASVQKVVMVSSIATVCFNPSYDQDTLKDETVWSDKEFCKEYENWYSLAKTEAEEMSLKYAEKNGLHVVTLLPCLVFGPLLQTVHLNTTSKVLLFMIKGGPDIMNNKFWPIIDVRDVADALLLVYEKAGSSERYICSTDQIDLKDVLNLMKIMYPNFSYAVKMVDVDYKVAVTSEKLKNLGWSPRKLEEIIADSVESYEKAGLLDGKPCRLPYIYRMPPQE
ncbi:hypothetical protein ABZP36_035926 [Zizania latifolia]